MANGFGAALRRLARGRLTLADLWLFLPPLALVIVLNLYLVRPYDFWWQLRTGQIIVTTGAIPDTDLFTFTRFGQPWTNQGWLVQAAYYLLFRAGGLPLIIFGHALTVTAGYALVEAACLRSNGGHVRAAVGATLTAAAMSIFNWNIRPQTASFLFFGAVVFVLETHRARGGRIIWTLPVLFALLVNMHGGFVFGLGLVGIYVIARAAEEWLRERRLGSAARRLLAAGVGSAVALLLNPAGPLGLVRYVVGFFQNAATQSNVEFGPLSLRTADGQILFAAIVLFLLIAYARRATVPPYQLAAGLAFGAFSFYSVRVEPWFGMAAAPAFALLLTPGAGVEASAGGAPARPPEGSIPVARQDRPLLNYAVLGLVALCVAASLPWFRPGLPIPQDRRSYTFENETPVAAAQVVCQLGSQARIFNDIGYGSYLSWACPQMPLFMDPRFELYPAEMWREYLQIGAGRYDWETMLAKYGVNVIFVNKRFEPALAAAAKTSRAWRVLYEDPQAIVLQRVTQ